MTESKKRYISNITTDEAHDVELKRQVEQAGATEVGVIKTFRVLGFIATETELAEVKKISGLTDIVEDTKK